MAKFPDIFSPPFFSFATESYIWNGFYTSKVSLLSPLIIGSKLSFSGWSDRCLPYSALFRVTSTTIYTQYKAQTMCKSWQSGSDSRCFLSKKQLKYFNGTRDPPPRLHWSICLKYQWPFVAILLLNCLSSPISINAAVRFYDQYSNFDLTKLVMIGIARGCWKCQCMGQFLQGGKNGRLMSFFFFKVEPPCDQTW